MSNLHSPANEDTKPHRGITELTTMAVVGQILAHPVVGQASSQTNKGGRITSNNAKTRAR